MENKVTNNNIQALRALAILLVIIQHLHRLPIPEWLMSTYSQYSYWTGVDIFFAISGFLMCKSLSSEIQKNGRSIKAFSSFFLKRLFRLTPALVFWCIVCLVIASAITPFWGVSPSKSIDTMLYSIPGISNFYFFNETVNGTPYDPLLSVTWSLSLEWQLYLILAILALSTKGITFRSSLIVLIVLSSVLLPNGINHQETLGWWIRPQAFFLGAIIFLFNGKLKELSLSSPLTLIAFSLTTYSLVYFTSSINPQYKLFFIGFLGAVSFALMAVCLPAFSFKILNWIGDRSYSIYLCHIPVMVLTRYLMDKALANTPLLHNSSIYIAVFVAIVALLSNFSYKYIERPLINFHRKRLTETTSIRSRT
ncbi:acyltransferase family protein [Enterobacter roggenkampii]|uniref:acyltransferase family protein n=1 Tax=Enterobacter roggenkampii TaxID=1812935 RepID=UPI00201A90D4|nr:acyltransferase [Enterobacter roggenkampii]MCL5589356.1 acyltransferase [Enterobacter roggenkampii]